MVWYNICRARERREIDRYKRIIDGLVQYRARERIQIDRQTERDREKYKAIG